MDKPRDEETTKQADLAAELVEWIQQVTGGTVAAADRMPGGNRRQAWLVDVDVPDKARLELFLRFDPLDPSVTGDPYTLWREAAVYRAAMTTDVPMPRLIAVHPAWQAMLTQRIGGGAAYNRVTDPATRVAVARDFMRHLASLHRADMGQMDLAALGAISTIPDGVRAELAIWERLYRESGRTDPMIELGLAWLERHIPAIQGPVVLVHGDAGPGNFLFEGDRITAVLDWELAHLGDPMEDLAWLSMRSVLESWPDFPARLRDYEAAGGLPVDTDRVRYYRVFVELRIVILRHRADGETNPSGDPANSLISWALNRRLLVEALAEATGVALEKPVPLEAPAGPQDRLYAAMQASLRDVIVPRSTDALVVAKAKSLARIAKFLQERDRLAPAAAARDRGDLTAILGAEPASVAEGRASLAEAVRQGRLADGEVLRYLARQTAADTQMMATALGALADRHFPPLDAN